jgi:hypothetical protein
MRDNVRSRLLWCAAVAVSLLATVGWTQDEDYKMPPTLEGWASAGVEAGKRVRGIPSRQRGSLALA